MSKFTDNLGIATAMAGVNIRAGLGDRKAFMLFALFMFANDLIMFATWFIYFGQFSSIRGWTLDQLCTLMGVVAMGFGLSGTISNGARRIAWYVKDGRLDCYLGRPVAPLLSITFSDASPASFGSCLSAPVFWFVFGPHTLMDVPLLMMLSFGSWAIIWATQVCLGALSFYLQNTERLGDQLYEFFLILACYPQKGFPFLVKILLFTLIPAGFLAYLPVEIMRELTLAKAAAMLVAVMIYPAFAVFFFNRGLKRYASANSFAAPV